MIKIYLPKNIKFIILNNKYIYIYNKRNFILFNFNSYNYYFNTMLNLLNINSKIILKNSIAYKRKNLNNFFFFMG